MEKIKLVIWDLDETFWKGTLSEGEVTFIPENINIVKELTQRGIINSISSKNDFDSAKQKLIEAGVWDYFVFPSINWQPKGEAVRNIIHDCQLRAPNILFIDDNISNRKEVEHYNEGINTKDEVGLLNLLSLPELKGKDDRSHSRLKQYKILEKKSEARSSYSDNRSFLRDSNIKIMFIRDVKPYKERILELINRTNQLNFTKIRLNENEINDLLNNPEIENVCLAVKDKFGDYGICGFYSLVKVQNRLVHYLFSCRILNLGVESYVYKKIGSPSIQVVFPVAGELKSDIQIDWIKEVNTFEDTKTFCEESKDRIRVLMLGGCDLEQMCHYVDSDKFEVIKEFNYPNDRGVPVHKEHTCYLKAMKECDENEKREIEELPFGDPKMFNSILYTDKYDVLVYSVLMNYTQEMFHNKGGKYSIAYGGYQTEEKLIESIHLSNKEKNFFEKKFSYIGQQSPEDFYKDLDWMCHNVNKPIFLINGAEVPDFNIKEKGANERHHLMNTILDKFICSHKEKCRLIDMRKYVVDRSDCKDNIRHYQRQVYIKMAEDMMTQLEGTKVRVGLGNIIIQRALVISRQICRKLVKIINNR